MKNQAKTGAFAAMLAAAFINTASAQAPTPVRPAVADWAATWIAPTQPLWASGFALPLGMPEQLEDATLRQFLRTSIGGSRIRLVISNEYSDRPLKIGRAHVARDGGAGSVAVRFGGAETVVVAPGAKALSDPIDMPVAQAERLQVDLYFNERTQLAGFHWDARENTLLMRGDRVGRVAPADAQIVSTRAFLSSVMVESPQVARAVVALGDSLTDGNGASPGTDHRWPDFLARRLASHGVSVLNAGISGNRLLRAGMGEAALARLDKDVLQQPGLQAVIVLLGTNDIGWPGGPFAPTEKIPSVDELIAGFRQLVAQAHLRGVRVVGATVAPFEDALKGTPLEGHFSPEKERVRQALNAWIRSAGAFDAVVDFDALLRDPARPAHLKADYDSGDHLHPNDAGYRAMAQALDLHLLAGPNP